MRFISRLTASEVNGPPLSVANTKPLSGNCRRSSRSDLISSPRSGCTDGLFEIANLDSPQTVPEGDQHQRGVAMAVAALPRLLHELFDFGLSQIFPRP